jgi:hypothetical protein
VIFFNCLNTIFEFFAKRVLPKGVYRGTFGSREQSFLTCDFLERLSHYQGSKWFAQTSSDCSSVVVILQLEETINGITEARPKGARL